MLENRLGSSFHAYSRITSCISHDSIFKNSRPLVYSSQSVALSGPTVLSKLSYHSIIRTPWTEEMLV